MLKTICVILLGSCLLGCQNDEDDSFNAATVIGPDYRYCACCGGYFIQIGNSTKRFNQFSENFANVDLYNATFPLKVFVVWREKPQSCMNDEIIVEVLEPRK